FLGGAGRPAPGNVVAGRAPTQQSRPGFTTGRRDMAATITAPRLMAIGGGALAELPRILAQLGLARPLIVTDPYIAGSGILDRATVLLDRAGIAWAVFSDTVPDPTTEVIGIGVERLKAGDFDSLVAIGGGSSIDTAKGMSVLHANGGEMRDYKVPNE